MNPNPDTNHISISTGTIVRFFAVAIILFSLYYLFEVVIVVLAAIVIASGIEPIVRRLKRYGVHRVVSIIIIYLCILAILACFIVFFMPVVVNDLINFLNDLPATISLQDLWNPINNTVNATTSLPLVSSHAPTQVISIVDIVNKLRSLVGVSGTGGGAFQTASTVFGGLFSFILIGALSFYLAVREDGVDDFLRLVTPIKRHEYIIHLWKRSQRKIGLWLQGQVLLGLIVGALVYVVLLLFGIPYALAFAVLAAILEIIPIFGPIIAAVPAVIIAFTERGIGLGIILILLYFVIQLFESNVFYPLVVKKIVGVNPIVVILALVIGAKMSGILGAIIAVPLSAALMEYISDIEKNKKAEINLDL